MFSGIIEKLAAVVSVTKQSASTALVELDLGELAGGVKVGDSLSLNGVCLTVAGKRKGIVSFDIIEETLRVTSLGELKKGSRVNVERSLQLSNRVGGHLVTGHIDGTGKVAIAQKEGDGSVKLWIETGVDILSMLIPKGSVAVDGVSLTLVDITPVSFSVCLIPHTLSTTTLGYKSKGDSTNIEVDVIGKYVKKYLEQMRLTA